MAKTASKSPAKKTAKKSNQSTQSAEEISGQLRELFVDAVKDIYWAEKNLTKALPKLQKAATSPELADAFTTHLEQTEEHVTRLEQVFELLEEKAQAKKCDAMEGLIQEANSIIEDTEEGTATRDVGLIMAAQKVEHYEIATYGSLRQLANTLELGEIVTLLEQTLEEEKETDELLTEIAENNVNYEAADEPAE